MLGKEGRAIRVASWNVNSIRARMEHVRRFLERQAPEVLLLQELKGTEFPAAEFRAMGYESAAVTQKAYNGVAVLSRLPMEVVCTTLKGDEEDSHARFLETRIESGSGSGSGAVRVVNLYLPNGNPIGTEKFAYKLRWMDRLAEEMRLWLADGVPTVIGGDWNVIPEEIDCHKVKYWERDALFQPETRARYRALLGAGWTDAFRSLYPETTGQFTYWDYFRDAFARNAGIRIDHFLLSPEMRDRLVGCAIDREPRAEEKPSDHTPIVVEFR